MTDRVPNLSLSHGQVTWCLAGGRPADKVVLDRVRYLRRLCIPFTPGELGQGRGGRVRYGFYHLIETGVALDALRLRMPPRFLKELAEHRTRYRPVYRDAYLELARHPEIFAGTGNDIAVLAEELFLRFHDRFSDQPGRITLCIPEGTESTRRFGDWVEIYDDEPERDVIALKSLELRLLQLAARAPVTKSGPRS